MNRYTNGFQQHFQLVANHCKPSKPSFHLRSQRFVEIRMKGRLVVIEINRNKWHLSNFHPKEVPNKDFVLGEYSQSERLRLFRNLQQNLQGHSKHVAQANYCPTCTRKR